VLYRIRGALQDSCSNIIDMVNSGTLPLIIYSMHDYQYRFMIDY